MKDGIFRVDAMQCVDHEKAGVLLRLRSDRLPASHHLVL